MTVQLQNKLLQREKTGNLRQLSFNQNLIDFASNDYLGLARSQNLVKKVIEGLNDFQTNLNGIGSTGSRLLSGNSKYAQDLEAKIAAFHGFEAGIIFNCGYMANLGLLSTIANENDSIFFDLHIHASTYEGIRLSKAKAFAFRHNDSEHLEKRLKNCSVAGERFICIESIYSTDGSKSPLKEMCYLAKKYEAHLIVDEAHAVGLCGHQGRGLIAEQNLQLFVFAQITTFGKALGCQGAIVLSNHIVKQALINFATSFIYTTALPSLSLFAIYHSYNLMAEMEMERAHLQKLIKIYQDSIPISSTTHIQSIPVEGNQACKDLSKSLLNSGFDVRALTSPTVPRRKEVLRICLHAFNTENELKHLLTLLNTKNRK